MMHVITVRNVNYALREALWRLHVDGVHCSTRNGDVLMLPMPCTTCYTRPTERVMFSALRDANPFFHLMESIWMLGGRDDVEFPATYAKQIAEYSDDGLTLAGGYGYRWRHRFGIDQLRALIMMLQRDKSTRRAVLQMWDCTTDLGGPGLDIPCNTHAYFSAVHGALDMTVCCRSNDVVWGAYGANVVHFSMLQQFVAEVLSIPIGTYYQISNNLHMYTSRPDVGRLYNDGHVRYVPDDRYDPTQLPGIVAARPEPLVQPREVFEWFLNDVFRFLEDPNGDAVYTTKFFAETVAPAQCAHTAYKAGDRIGALHAAAQIRASDWRVACVEWLGRRYAK